MTDVKLAGSLWLTRVVARTFAGFGDLVAELDRPARQRNPYPLYSEIRSRGPWYRSRLGLYATASHGVITELVRHPEISSGVLGGEAGGATAKAAFPADAIHPLRDSLTGIDPPDHTRLRRLVVPAFTPRASRARAEQIERIVDELISKLPKGEPFDLIEHFTAQLPVLVMCDLLGVPVTEVHRLTRWGRVVGAAGDGVRTVAQSRELTVVLAEMEQFFRDLLERRKADPGEDVISRILHEANGEPTPRELIALCELTLLAGFETLVNFIGTALLALLTNPEQLALLRGDLDLVPQTVDEALRFDAPIQSTLRAVRSDLEIDGHVLPAGKPIIVLYGGANRDPAVFEHPDRFDITRPNSRDHLAFAAGTHYCLGASLAKLEGEIALRALVTRLPGLKPAGEVEWLNSFVVRGLRRLPVVVSP
ncbi:cytochrome P450 [Allokutzneria sp. A3M-2-11 16]|uniref:cytochrome P450 n=1 Tax=Allokutzneria sp. A3M-2-11 16 TaxID=2962043 RepID=UPI0020B704D2|nr:cytochrome P450 [Allokutzneria sp. A3M-2-11 16]MCP3803321.1 cytochrome P450 [Allokutzneria sp. A3M-2-11 16]